jgi:hypothetical protein
MSGYETILQLQIQNVVLIEGVGCNESASMILANQSQLASFDK